MIRPPPISPLFPYPPLSRSPSRPAAAAGSQDAGELRSGYREPRFREQRQPQPDRLQRHVLRQLRFLSARGRSEEHTSELQSQSNLVCRLLLEKKKTNSQLIE